MNGPYWEIISSVEYTNENSSIVRLLDASAKEERDKDVITRLWNADEIPMHHSGHEAGAKKKIAPSVVQPFGH